MLEQKRRIFRYTRDNYDTLANNGTHQFASRYALSIYAADAIYSYIPKNACSTMRYTLGRVNGTIRDESDFNWIHGNNRTFQASLSELAKAKYVFTILRDPYMRLGSCYLNIIVDGTPPAWEFYRATKYKILPQMMTFREFVNNLQGRLLRTNEHWRPQIDFLIYDNYDDFFCLEAFSEAEAVLQQRIGLVVRDARNLTKHGTDQFEPIPGGDTFADTPSHEIATLKRRGLIPRIAQLYDAPLIAQAAELYKADITLYTNRIKRPLVFPPPA